MGRESGLTKEAESRYGTAESKLKIMWNRLKDIAITSGRGSSDNDALDAAEPFVNAIARLADGLQLNPGLKRALLCMLLAASYGPVYGGRKMAQWYAALIPLMAKLRTGQLSLNAAMKANPIGMVVTAIYLLITAGILLWKNWDTISEFFVSAWGRIKITTLKAIDAMLAGLEKFIGWIPGIENAIKKARDSIEELITAEQAAEIERNAKKAADAVEEQTQTIRDAVKAMREDYERAKKTAEAMGKSLTKTQSKSAD